MSELEKTVLGPVYLGFGLRPGFLRVEAVGPCVSA